MQWKETYNDLCEEISALEHRAKDLSDQLESAYQMCYDGKMPGDTFSRIPLDKALENYDSIKGRLITVLEWLERKKQTKSEMDECIGRMTGLENQIAYRRTVMRQTIRQIASDLGYSEGYVKNVSYRMMRDETNDNIRNVTVI